MGVVLHGLSMCGHEQAHTLAESVGSKWLHQLREEGASAPLDQLVPVMVGMAGLVGVEPVRGVAWVSASGPAEHMEMVLVLAYLLVDTLEKVSYISFCVKIAARFHCKMQSEVFDTDSGLWFSLVGMRRKGSMDWLTG